jgi:magnesium chelatase subunit D
VCAAFEVDGLRADIVTARTAVAHAAWEGRDDVTRADIRRAAILALPHRRRRNPFDAPGLDEERLDQILGEDELPPDPEPDDPGPPPGGQDAPEESGQPDGPDAPPPDGGADGGGSAPDAEPPDNRGPQDQAGDETEPPAAGEDGAPPTAPAPPPGGEPSGITVRSGTPYRPRLLTVRGLGGGADGRRSRAISSHGHRIGARRVAGGAGGLHLLETLFAAAGKQATRGRSGDRVELRREDLRVAVREGHEANLILFCVDASGSMAARKRMTQVKTAILSLLLDAYRRRDKVGLITFRGQRAELALPPTHSADIAAARLDELPAGGRTPLAEGLLEAARVLLRERRRDSRLRPLLIVVTDGRATSGADAVRRSLRAADYVAGLGVSTVVIDGESGPMRLGLAARLAERLGAEHLPVAEVSVGTLTATVREHTSHVEGAA